MGSNGGEDAMVYAGNDTECSEATVEIKIKTLDSQTYSLRVDKFVPVPALKEQIANVTGVLSEQQRLICRGKVLKDDQLLSAYHVEDGHTLHMVVRQPIPLSSEHLPNHPGDPASGTDRSQGNQAGPGLVVETFNISEQGDRVLPGLSRIISAVLGSFGMPNVESGSEGIDLREAAPGRLSETLGLGGLRNSSRQQSNQTATRGQYNTNSGASLFPAAVPLDPQQPQVIPDSLTTLSQYLGQMRQEFNAVRGQSNNSETVNTHGGNGQHSDAASASTAGRRGLPTPSSLAEVLLSTRQILNEQAEECLSHLTRQLEDHTNVTGPLERMQIQSNALRTGVLLQNLGALLLELGRTTMTLNMGQTPADAVVNAGPAVFISTSGPNPMMVQPLPFHPGMSFGAIPLGSAQPGSGPSEHSVGSGFLPRNIDIRIRTGSLMASVNQSEPTGTHPLGQTDPAASVNGNSVQSAAAGATGSLPSTRDSEVRVVPIRALVAAVPSPVGSAPSNSSRGSLGIFYPVLARVQHADSRNLNSTVGSLASDEHNPRSVDMGGQPIPDSAVQHQNTGVDVNGRSGGVMTNGQGFSAQGHSGLDQLLRTIFPGEPIHGSDIFGTTAVTGPVAAQVPVNTQEAAPVVGDEGAFLSNLLHQIMPIISQNAATGSNSSSTEGANVTQDRTTQASSTQAQEDQVRGTGTSSRRQCNPSSQPSSKRQKRE